MDAPFDRADPRVRHARHRFAEQASRDDADVELAEAALWIAAEARPGIDVSARLRDLDAFAARAEPAVAAARDDEERVAALGRVLFHDLGFHGNRDDYYDPRNSDLDAVLTRRTGIPITLSIVLLEVAWRVGLRATGIGFPGHYLVKIVGAREIVVDAFEGRTLDERECAERLRAALGPDAHFDRGWLRAARHKETLARVLSNLKQIHVARDEPEAALACVERILLLAPDAILELRDRGLLYARLECFRAAEADLERFLALAPGHADANAVRETLEWVRRRVERLH